MQTNHLAHFLLTKELFPLLTMAAVKRGEARIVNHSSGFRSVPSTPLEAKYLGKNGGNLGGNGNSVMLGGGRWQRYHQVRLQRLRSWLLDVDSSLQFSDRARWRWLRGGTPANCISGSTCSYLSICEYLV